ncbi:hypothetical protein GCM10023156_05950 [Novipirellula rosea]|uniref:Uncharacterized protein n=1 Tax=Novipirellula rosea TaxID=1031540 RepID=A0ABP8M7I3_9BACT
MPPNDGGADENGDATGGLLEKPPPLPIGCKLVCGTSTGERPPNGTPGEIGVLLGGKPP